MLKLYKIQGLMMLCAERMQRIIQAFILGAILTLAGLKMFAAAFILTAGMAFMLFFAGVTGFCPGLMMLKKMFPPCEKY